MWFRMRLSYLVTTSHVLCDKLSVDARLLQRQTVCMNGEQQFLKRFGKRLSILRRNKGITQEQLADMVEVHRTYVGYIEQGKRNPSIGNAHRIAKALKVDIKDLF